MWTTENRHRYDRDKLRYPSDLTDAEWQLIKPLIPPAKRGGGKRTVDMAILRDIYDAAQIDGATGVRNFTHIVWPLLASLYLLCTLLFTLWTIGDFVTVHFVSGGAPVWSTDVLATRGFQYAFDEGQPALGVAAALSALPLLVPVAIMMMRMLQAREMQL